MPCFTKNPNMPPYRDPILIDPATQRKLAENELMRMADAAATDQARREGKIIIPIMLPPENLQPIFGTVDLFSTMQAWQALYANFGPVAWEPFLDMDDADFVALLSLAEKQIRHLEAIVNPTNAATNPTGISGIITKNNR